MLIAWDSGCGPTWGVDPFGRPIKAKFLGSCEVWRSSDGKPAVSLGETSAEAFLDDQVANYASVHYWVMEIIEGGGQRQVGPVIDVIVQPARLEPDTTPPSPPNELRCRRKSGGNELSWLASVDDESGVLAYLVYSDNGHQPDAVLWVNDEDPLDRPAYGEGTDPTEEEAALGETDPVWELDEHGDPIIDEWGNRKAKEHARIKWLDRTTDTKKPYILRAIDNALNLSEPTGRVDPWTGEPAPSVWPPGTVPSSYVGQVKGREPVEPVVPEGDAHVVIGSVMLMYDDGSNYAAACAAWDAVGLDTCDFECFMAEDVGANWPVLWTGNSVVFPAARWAYPEVFTPNAHWRSLGVKTAHRPADAADTWNDATWDVPDDIAAVNNGTGQSLWWFCLRAPVRVDEPPDGMLRSYGLHAYWPVAHVPDGSMFLDCQLAHNYVSEPLLYNVAVLETPSNYDSWPPLP